jgi:3-oxoadipate enol-lactonase
LNLSAEAPGLAPGADHYLNVDAAARLRYRDEGRGTPVLLVHGWTVDLNIWEAQVQALREAFRVVRFDRRGFGYSSGIPSVADDVRDIDTVCRRLEIQRVALVAMSQGTRAAASFAIANPERLSCLVLDGPPEFDSRIPGSQLSLAPFRELVRSQGLSAFREQWLLSPLMRLHRADARARELLRAVVKRYPGSDLSEGFIDVPPPDICASLGLLAIPVLVITGEHDLPPRVKSADELARRLPCGARAVIPGAGHLSNLDNPEAYNRAIAQFLAQHAHAAA